MVNIYEQYKKLTGNGVRLNELIDNLDEIDKLDSANSNDRIVDGGVIEFKNVDIYTPSKTKLVENISFQVGQHDSMLLTGHNGAGKSSVFRCLASLWSIDTGSITKPGGGQALAGKVFYLPQKPYQVLGSLFDQISYPATHDPAHLTAAMAAEILDEVELGYLAERPDIFTKETHWEEDISLGEKQSVYKHSTVASDV